MSRQPRARRLQAGVRRMRESLAQHFAKSKAKPEISPEAAFLLLFRLRRIRLRRSGIRPALTAQALISQARISQALVSKALVLSRRPRCPVLLLIGLDRSLQGRL